MGEFCKGAAGLERVGWRCGRLFVSGCGFRWGILDRRLGCKFRATEPFSGAEHLHSHMDGHVHV